MKIKNFSCFAIILLVVGVFLLPKNPAAASEITPKNLIKLTNKERIKHNITPLTVSLELEKAAKNKALDLLDREYFSHTSPEGKNFVSWIKEVNYAYIYAGENLAMDFITSEGVINAWMKSKTHKKNILNPNYSEIAIAVENGTFNNRPTIMITQLFGRPKDKNFLSSRSGDRLTLLNFNAIINNDYQKILVFPSLINNKSTNIVHLNNKNDIEKLSFATIKNNTPKKSDIQINEYPLSPTIAGESINIKDNPKFFITKSLMVYLSVISLFLLTSLFTVMVALIYEHHYPHLSHYK